MTTTPTTHHGVWVESVALPTDLLADNSVISWSQAKTRLEELTAEELTAGTDTLLEDFLALASADPDQMAAFMDRYGVLELCGEHGRPVDHDEGAFCPFLEVDDGQRFGVSVQHVRRAARAFADLAQWGHSTRLGLKRRPGSGMDAQMLVGGFIRGSNLTDRDRIAEYLTILNRQTGVRPLVTWDKRLSFTFAAGGLLGVLTILLTREIASRDDVSYNCSVCGFLVARKRPPKPDEAVYCAKASCRTEQQRRNQAAWRARKRAEGKS
jgi:hypothetical protein